MGWNRPQTESKANDSPRRTGTVRPTVTIRRTIAGAIVALGAGIVAWFLWPSAKPQTANHKPQAASLIKEVKPQLSAKEQEKLEHPGQVKIRGKWYPEYNKEGGKIWYNGQWVRYHTPVVYTNKTLTTPRSPIGKMFENRADREIALLLAAPPGARRMGVHEFNKSFEKQFLKSLTTPIIVTKDDDEWAASVKRAVNETKIELKARYDAGEDIVQIMNDAQKQQQELAIYRDELKRMVQKSAIKDTKDPQARKDLYDAANKMLAERGLQPLSLPSMLERRLALENLQELKQASKSNVKDKEE